MADYIDRQEVIETVAFYREDPDGIDHALNSIKNIPSADVAPILKSHWYWDEDGMDWGIGAWCCDNCKSRAETWWALDKKYNPLRCSGGKFCGNCGAKMDLVI